VLKIFSCALTSYSGLIIALHKWTEQPTSIEFLKIDALQDLLFTSKSLLSFLNGRGPQSIWRETTDEKWNK